MGGTLGHLRLRVRRLRTLRPHASHFHVASRRVVMKPSWWILSDRGQWPLFFDMGRGPGPIHPRDRLLARKNWA